METFKTYNINSGINLHYSLWKKFKTFTISIYFHRILSKADATKNALIPYILKRGNAKFHDSRQLSQYVEQLYGAYFDCGVMKKGEDQILFFNIEGINDEFLPQKEAIMEKALKLLYDVIYAPLIENSTFKKEYVEQEKEKLKLLIESSINDKTNYAIQRCFEEMCVNEPFSINELGRIEDINGINEINLYEHYQKIITTSPVDIFITGNLESSNIIDLAQELFADHSVLETAYPVTQFNNLFKEPKNVREEIIVEQAKLCMGFRTHISSKDSKYDALIVYNEILGGGAYSKLFVNIREKLSLCYSIFSTIEKFKGILLINSGIDVKNYEKTVEEILSQMEKIKKGDVTEIEIKAAINSLSNRLKSIKDQAFYLSDYHLGQLVSGTHITIDELINRISRVVKKNIVEAAQSLRLDTVYLLAPRKNKEDL